MLLFEINMSIDAIQCVSDSVDDDAVISMQYETVSAVFIPWDGL